MQRNTVKTAAFGLAGAAVLVASSMGGAVAAGMLGSDDIINNSLQQEDLQADSVGNSELQPEAVRWGNINARAQDRLSGSDGDDGVDGTDGAQGPAGPAGKDGATGSAGKDGADSTVAGPQGLKGDPGTPGQNGDPGQAGAPGQDGKDGVSGYEVRSYDYTLVSGGGIATVACSAGKFVLGGGYQWKDEDVAMEKGLSVVWSRPGRMDWNTNQPKADDNTGWIIRPNKPANVNPGALTVYAICANV